MESKIDKNSPEAARLISAALNEGLRTRRLSLDRQPPPSLRFFNYPKNGTSCCAIFTPYGVCGVLYGVRNSWRGLAEALGDAGVARAAFDQGGRTSPASPEPTSWRCFGRVVMESTPSCPS